MPAKMTQEQFIEKAKAIHGDSYSYKETVFVNLVTKVVIDCPIHGSFVQKPQKHLAGQGCKICGFKKISQTKQKDSALFLEQIKVVHGNCYDYSEMKYIGNKKDINIICKTHGRFKQNALNHLMGSGCPQCAVEKNAINKRKSLVEFLAKANDVHGDKYDYSKVIDAPWHEKVIISCVEHGDFEQSKSEHLQGKGCRECSFKVVGEKGRLSHDEFIAKANELHDFKYSYAKTKYLIGVEKVIITCPEHGDFEQQAQVHLQGHGCYDCRVFKPVSANEQAMFDFIKQYVPAAKQSVRNMLDGKEEMDVVIESMGLAFEYNGLYFHSEKFGKDRHYHQSKTDAAQRNNIRLIHIFDDEWVYKREWCESYIKRILKVEQQVVYARKCVTKVVAMAEVRSFLEQYHLQGSAGEKAMAFYDKDELIAVATTKTLKNGQVELSRWCVKFGITLHGGLGKVAKYLPFDISYCDTAKFDGHGYTASGMKLLRKTQPSYWYTNGKVRKNRIDFQKHKLLNNPKAKGETERELANSLGWYQISGLRQLVFGWT